MMSADDHNDLEEIELDLSQEESLPWLESDEDDEEPGGFDARQIIVFVAFLLALLVLGLLALWYFTKQTEDPALVADGSTIEAPEGPYKEKPEDPGGKEFAGTGNVAPAVGEGQTPDAVVAETNPPGPSISTVSTDDVPVEQDGIGVQVGAFGSRARAEIGWQNLVQQTTALSGVRYRVIKGEADIGTVYRLQAVADDVGAADALCRALRNDGVACQVKR